nr:reverse transcriptase domain-containing protein [Tanacetum cinerariifolium]
MGFMQRFLRLAGFLGAAAGIEEEQAKNFQWGLRRSTLNHLMCMSYTDVAQVANAARNYEILHERDDEDIKRPDKRGVVIGISRPLSRVVTGATVIIATVMDQTGVVVVTTTAAVATTTLPVTTGIPIMDVTRETWVISPTDLPILVLNSPGVPLRVTLTQFALLVDVDTQESVIELRVLASSVVKLAIYRKIARRTPLRLHLFDGKIRAINALPLDMCEFDLILGMDWLTKHHATIDCRSYQVIFGDIHAPEFVYHGSLPGKSMQIISALQARTLLSHGCEEFPDVFPDKLPGIPPVREEHEDHLRTVLQTLRQEKLYAKFSKCD